MCETLMLDVMAPEAHQNVHGYIRELSEPTFNSLCKNLAWWLITWRTSKNHKSVKMGGWALVWGWALARDFAATFSTSKH